MQSKLLKLIMIRVGGVILGVIIALVFTIIHYQTSRIETEMTEFKDHYIERTQNALKEQVEVAHGVIQFWYEESKKGDLGDAYYQEKAGAAIAQIKWGNDGYYFVYTTEGICVMLPPKPHLIGKSLIGLKDSLGNKILVDFIEAAKRGGDFTRYVWDKPSGKKEVPKLAFVLPFNDWNWLVGTGVYIDDVDEALEARKAQLNAELNMVIWATVIVGIMVFVALLTVLFLILQDRLKRVSEITLKLKEIAASGGDLTKRIEVTDETEIGDLGRGFNAFVDSVRHLLQQVSDVSLGVAQASQTLRKTSVDISSGAEQLSNQTNGMASASEESSAGMLVIKNRVDELNSMVSNARSNVSVILKSVEDIANKSKFSAETTIKAQEKTSSTRLQMNELEKSAQEISKVVDLIKNIASQTNLLALNATIEAASAGEAGKGFAVVAAEVKELANQTAKATDQIRNIVNVIQASATNSGKSIVEISEIVAQVNVHSAEFLNLSESMRKEALETTHVVDRTSTASHSITQNISEMSTASNEISGNMGRLMSVTQQNSQSAQQVLSNAELLAADAQKLKTILGRFRL